MKIAIWLMDRFGVDEGLVGDLTEENAPHRSHVWIWRQAIAAIVGAGARDLRAHPVLSGGAVIVGLSLLWLSHDIEDWLWGYLNVFYFRAVMYVGIRHQTGWVSGIVVSVVAIPFWFCIGWLVARLHRMRTSAAVFAFLAVMWCFALPVSWRQFDNALRDVRFGPYFAVEVAAMCLLTVSVLAGALYAKENAHEIA
jgi:hypothetical protein